MAFFDKVKGFLGIGGVKIALEVPPDVTKESKKLSGKVTLTTTSDQQVESITVKLMEKYTTGSGDSKTTREFELGKAVINQPFEIKISETKAVDFTIDFEMLKSKNDQLKEQGGVLGALGKVGSFVQSEKSEYYVEAMADVKAAALDPTDKKNIRLL